MLFLLLLRLTTARTALVPSHLQVSQLIPNTINQIDSLFSLSYSQSIDFNKTDQLSSVLEELAVKLGIVAEKTGDKTLNKFLALNKQAVIALSDGEMNGEIRALLEKMLQFEQSPGKGFRVTVEEYKQKIRMAMSELRFPISKWTEDRVYLVKWELSELVKRVKVKNDRKSLTKGETQIYDKWKLVVSQAMKMVSAVNNDREMSQEEANILSAVFFETPIGLVEDFKEFHARIMDSLTQVWKSSVWLPGKVEQVKSLLHNFSLAVTRSNLKDENYYKNAAAGLKKFDDISLFSNVSKQNYQLLESILRIPNSNKQLSALSFSYRKQIRDVLFQGSVHWDKDTVEGIKLQLSKLKFNLENAVQTIERQKKLMQNKKLKAKFNEAIIEVNGLILNVEAKQIGSLISEKDYQKFVELFEKPRDRALADLFQPAKNLMLGMFRIKDAKLENVDPLETLLVALEKFPIQRLDWQSVPWSESSKAQLEIFLANAEKMSSALNGELDVAVKREDIKNVLQTEIKQMIALQLPEAERSSIVHLQLVLKSVFPEFASLSSAFTKRLSEMISTLEVYVNENRNREEYGQAVKIATSILETLRKVRLNAETTGRLEDFGDLVKLRQNLNEMLQESKDQEKQKAAKNAAAMPFVPTTLVEVEKEKQFDFVTNLFLTPSARSPKVKQVRAPTKRESSVVAVPVIENSKKEPVKKKRNSFQFPAFLTKVFKTKAQAVDPVKPVAVFEEVKSRARNPRNSSKVNGTRDVGKSGDSSEVVAANNGGNSTGDDDPQKNPIVKIVTENPGKTAAVVTVGAATAVSVTVATTSPVSPVVVAPFV